MPSKFSRFTNLHIENVTDSSCCTYKAHFGKSYRYYLFLNDRNLKDYLWINYSKDFRIRPNNRYLINNKVNSDATDVYYVLEVDSLKNVKLGDFDKKQLYSSNLFLDATNSISGKHKT